MKRSHLKLQRRPPLSRTEATGWRFGSIRPALLAGTILALILAAAAPACASGPQVAIVADNGRELARVKVEIANTAASRELGLMYRKHLDEMAGMIFVFPAPARLGFWMKNTEIPLDMIFADGSGRIVGIVENAEPFSDKTEGVNQDAQYVLEVNGGFAQRHQVTAGDFLKFHGFTPQASE